MVTMTTTMMMRNKERNRNMESGTKRVIVQREIRDIRGVGLMREREIMKSSERDERI